MHAVQITSNRFAPPPPSVYDAVLRIESPSYALAAKSYFFTLFIIYRYRRVIKAKNFRGGSVCRLECRHVVFVHDFSITPAHNIIPVVYYEVLFTVCAEAGTFILYIGKRPKYYLTLWLYNIIIYWVYMPPIYITLHNNEHSDYFHSR